MKIKIIIISIIGCLSLGSSNATAIEAAPKISDREIIEKLTRLETQLVEGMNGLNKRIDDVNKRFDDVNKRIDEIKDGQKTLEGRIDTLIYAVWGSFAALMGCLVALIGFVIWDRRTALSPAIRKNKELEERDDKIEKALKEYAYKEPRLAEILRNVGIM
ncbi:MAG: heme exporter protein CcmD [Nitrospinae bacterium]|nr:heme exporter protein CcmD [Nitrospinota bacterium]MBI3813131.1 heme exporter protein CcmD [Nitrospinota bacterium]